MLRNFSGTGYLAAPLEPTKNPNWLSFRLGFHKKEKNPQTKEEGWSTMWARGLVSRKAVENTLHLYVKGAVVSVSTTDLWSRMSKSQDGAFSSELSLGFVNYIFVHDSKPMATKTNNTSNTQPSQPAGVAQSQEARGESSPF